MDHGTDPFDVVGAPFFTGDTAILHGKGRVIGTGRVAVFVIADFFQGGFRFSDYKGSGLLRNGNH